MHIFRFSFEQRNTFFRTIYKCAKFQHDCAIFDLFYVSSTSSFCGFHTRFDTALLGICFIHLFITIIFFSILVIVCYRLAIFLLVCYSFLFSYHLESTGWVSMTSCKRRMGKRPTTGRKYHVVKKTDSRLNN